MQRLEWKVTDLCKITRLGPSFLVKKEAKKPKMYRGITSTKSRQAPAYRVRDFHKLQITRRLPANVPTYHFAWALHFVFGNVKKLLTLLSTVPATRTSRLSQVTPTCLENKINATRRFWAIDAYFMLLNARMSTDYHCARQPGLAPLFRLAVAHHWTRTDNRGGQMAHRPRRRLSQHPMQCGSR